MDRIGAALSGRFDVTAADALRANKESGSCVQGQTHGHKGFLLAQEEAKALMKSDPRNHDFLKPYLTADEFLSSNPPAPGRYVMDFHPRSMLEARASADAFSRIEEAVLPARQKKAADEHKRNKEAIAENQNAHVNHHHQNFLNKWWLLSYPRPALMKKLRELLRYVACGRVTKRPIFVFVDANVNPTMRYRFLRSRTTTPSASYSQTSTGDGLSSGARR